ncbi:MAG: class I SAM-dependent methyltransferase [Polyangiaceae bacterium]|jgi:hypothetical protein|nr:class I SAM-dependent methyltransferase [Polyangiaceae bacterium]
MLAFWPDVIRPLFHALLPTTIVEIGSESGKTTRLLLDYAREHEARVHAIDPAPRFDPESWRQSYGDAFVMHRLPSLVALPTLDLFDVVLVDGDHNWFTVYHELLLIEQRSAEIGQPFPLVFLHDVGWPYGRRDLYYDPDAIPEEYRQAWARRGISPTSNVLLPTGGFNAHLCNAVHEGGPRNGVLTAVEDFRAQSKTRLALARIPAVFGLGILLPEPLAKEKPEVARRVGAWMIPDIERFIDRLEMARIAMLSQAV